MQFIFNERKAAQAMAHLLGRHRRRRMNYMVAVKVLYLSDRDALVKSGRPITGDLMVSMTHGPTLSLTLNLIREPSWVAIQGHKETGDWSEYIKLHGRREIEGVKSEPERDELADFEIQVLNEMDDRFGGMDWKEISRWTHENLAEWRDPQGSSHWIYPETILRDSGWSDDDINDLCSVTKDLWLFNRPHLPLASNGR